MLNVKFKVMINESIHNCLQSFDNETQVTKITEAFMKTYVLQTYFIKLFPGKNFKQQKGKKALDNESQKNVFENFFLDI